MAKRVLLICMLTSWLFATGTQWDVVQVFAWSRMLVGYARVMPLKEAVKETFDAEKPCSLCTAVRKAKTQENTPVLPSDAVPKEKALPALQPAQVIVVAVPDHVRWRLHDSASAGEMRAAPPLPPPRSAG